MTNPSDSPAPHLAGLVSRLRGWANQIAARFGYPVYLVGSSLTDPDARDVDVRVVLHDDGFFARYGIAPMRAEGQAWVADQSDGTRRLYADMAKLSRGAALVLHLNIDFQVQSESIVLVRRHHEKPRVRLDTLELDEVGAEGANDPAAEAGRVFDAEPAGPR